MKRTIRVLAAAVALLGIAGCGGLSSESHGPNGITCRSESHGFLMFVTATRTCTDAAGNVISSGRASTY